MPLAQESASHRFANELVRDLLAYKHQDGLGEDPAARPVAWPDAALGKNAKKAPRFQWGVREYV
jgi:hypothetical protein